ncbi:MAG: YihY/virulence factor BrkB family protein [Gemmataceae bacterium]
MRVRDFWQIMKDTGRRWYEANTFRLGASLAFYTVFSLSPLLLLAVAIAGGVFGHEAARRQVGEEIAVVAGSQVGSAFQDMLRAIYESGSGGLATTLGVILLLVGAASVFTELQDALNLVWGVEGKQTSGVWDFVRSRFWTFAMVLVIGFLLLVSLVVSAALTAVATYVDAAAVPGGAYLWMAVNAAVAFGLAAVLFALIYKILPNVEIAWRDALAGGAITAVLFAAGKHLIGLYLGQSSVASAYGAAGSLVMILLWVYYSSQILLLGAEFTYVLWQRRTHRADTAGTTPPQGTPDAGAAPARPTVGGAAG